MSDLRCEGVAKSYGGRVVLSGVDLAVPEGTLTAILGASGSGKTTLLRIVIGFLPLDHGRVAVGGTVLADAGRVHIAPDKRLIGYVAQEGALFPHLTVAENVAFGLPRAQRRAGARVLEMLDLVGLDRGYARGRPHELSGGEQRRVALARALAPGPRVVLLDEPFSGLDAALRAETREAVQQALAGEDTTAVLVTHDQAEALSMGREVAVLRGGRLVQTAEPAVLYRDPVDLELARFVGEAVVVPGYSRDGVVDCELGTSLPVRGRLLQGSVQVLIRPEQIRLSQVDGVAAEVVGSSYRGADKMLRLVLRDPAGTRISARTFDDDLPANGETVRVEVAGSVAVFSEEER
ncbi:MAG TPA: ABC transporter ATP-binding protein [Gaiellaceae bacterium]